MFNGIIRNTGIIDKIYRKKNNCTINVKSNIKFLKSEIGSSISCSGACLTLEKFSKRLSTFYISKETLKRTTFNSLMKGDIINLEKSLRFGDRVSGHFVQGHVDTTSKITKIEFVGKSWFINFKIKSNFSKLLIEKGSISVNGVSLTLSKVFKNGFQIVVIPHTLKLTNLMFLKENDMVNIEFDILSKYIKKFSK